MGKLLFHTTAASLCFKGRRVMCGYIKCIVDNKGRISVWLQAKYPGKKYGFSGRVRKKQLWEFAQVLNSITTFDTIPQMYYYRDLVYRVKKKDLMKFKDEPKKRQEAI